MSPRAWPSWRRLGLADTGTTIPVAQMLPAPAQGAVGIEVRADDANARDRLAVIGDADTYACVMAERALLRALGGTCHSPVAALARMDAGRIRLDAEILSSDGSEHVAGSAAMAPGDDAPALALGHDLLARASAGLRALFAG